MNICSVCKHRDVEIDAEPCATCLEDFMYTKWEPHPDCAIAINHDNRIITADADTC